jgi:hypothetical protein
LQGTAVVGQSGRLDGIRMAEVSVPTYNATIYIGLKERASGQSATAESLSEYLQAYVSTCGRDTPAGCITVTPTKFVYVDGFEDGFAIGFINYPRFPSTAEAIRASALQLGRALADFLHQCRVSVVFPSDTVMITTSAAEIDATRGH